MFDLRWLNINIEWEVNCSRLIWMDLRSCDKYVFPEDTTMSSCAILEPRIFYLSYSRITKTANIFNVNSSTPTLSSLYEYFSRINLIKFLINYWIQFQWYFSHNNPAPYRIWQSRTRKHICKHTQNLKQNYVYDILSVTETKYNFIFINDLLNLFKFFLNFIFIFYIHFC